MIRTTSPHPQAQQAYALVTYLQNHFISRLNALSHTPFEAVEWLRDEGVHGGGIRYEARDEKIFDRASVNISQIHYSDLCDKALDSATAISTIIHPANPLAPSMHMHISWTQMKEGHGYWRIMADLNPSNPIEEDTQAFLETLKEMAPNHKEEALAQGDKYFFIPALGRTRGVAHFYLENFSTDDKNADSRLALQCGEKVINRYIQILEKRKESEATQAQKDAQLAYHTLYLFQVLTLDRGTTSGLLVHDQNDIGILGSLPSHVDKSLLQSWIEKMPAPQEKLLRAIIEHVPDSTIMIDTTHKQALANAVREHYKNYPQALSLQASGNSIPPTVKNHR